jgi:PAS domain S-box-containing protein
VSELNRDELQPLRSTVTARAAEADRSSSALHRMVAQLVLETTSEGIWLIDAQARTTFVNRPLLELLGYSEEEMIGKHIFDFMDEEQRAVAQQNLIQRQRGVEDRKEVRLRKKDGTFVWLIGSANPVYDRDGRYAGALALMGDLTAQKAREGALRAEVEALTARLRERTAAAPAPAEASGNGRPSLVREGLRAVGVLAVCGTFVSLTGIMTVAGVAGALVSRRRGPTPPLDE